MPALLLHSADLYIKRSTRFNLGPFEQVDRVVTTIVSSSLLLSRL